MPSLRHIALAGLCVAAILGAPVDAPSASPDSTIAPPRVAQAPAPVARPVVLAEPSPDVEALRSQLDQMIRSSVGRNPDYSVLVVSLDRGDTLFSHNPDHPLAPASNMKLFSTAAALYYLGPDFRYSTYALADGEVRDGSLDGDLVLYGTGDPTISSRMLSGALTPLRALADSLRALGVHEIRGSIIGDGSYFDDAYIAEGWREEYRLAAYSAPVGALSLAENIISVRVRPGTTGEQAQITTTPATDGLLVLNQVRTIASGGSAVRFAYDPEGLVVSGQLARGHPGVARTVTVVDPGNFAAAAFRMVLQDAGIEVLGGVRSVRDPEQSAVGRATRAPADAEGVPAPPRVIATHLSPTLAQIVTVTNHVSQNLYAEALFKTVGRVALGNGSFKGGSEAVRYFLECEKPIDFAFPLLVDGSGLSPLNRVTTRSVIHLLDLMTRTDVWSEFYRSLPEAAALDGGPSSLRGRMGGTAAARNLRAKTGTIANVSSLSGYVHAGNGELIAFSIFGNGLPSTWTAKRLEDGIGARLANFTRPEPVEPPPVELEVEQIGIPTDTVAPPIADPVDTTAAPEPAPEPAAPVEPAPRPAPQPAAQPAAPATRTHRVARGETLDAIADKYGTNVTELQRLNPSIRPRYLQIGQEVTVPGTGAAASAPAAATPAPTPARATTRTHRVGSGETLEAIAKRYGTTVAVLERLNPTIRPRYLQIDQRITLP